ncbi:hypothetical protein PR048_008411 [Dryococelus australis]|uniref:HTH CENPB-type domain-containing protein n=1 Tax=Dryococelus australis TaxID=614101 RepID=A0ABQ9HX21_9NEOP|nr:hypothetical protein PR048_008411 [Dryococelus australis]
MWFREVRENRSLFSGPMPQAKALEFYDILKEDWEGEFTASLCWLDRIKKINGVCQLNITGEILTFLIMLQSTQMRINWLAKKSVQFSYHPTSRLSSSHFTKVCSGKS